jgi:energy-coupling factor transporter ATP-binding protein EcfA2
MSSLWRQYGLRRNPFFQEPLAEDGDGPELEAFFTGRSADRADCLTRLTHDEQTRLVLLGAPGVGKTTLLNRLLADVRQPDGMRIAWIVAALPPLNLPKAATIQDFCIEVLRQVVDMRRQMQAAQTVGPSGTKSRVTKAAGATRQAFLPGKDLWESIERTVEGALTLSPQAFGVGVTATFTAPHAGVASWVPLTKQAMTQLAHEYGRDLVFAVNNAENLRSDIAARATSVLAEARDLFLTPHTHWVFVGTPDFFDAVIKPVRQLPGVMGYPVLLPPLDAAGVEELIERRYEELRVPQMPFVPPIRPEDAGALAHAFVGDLRELLRALEMTVVRLTPVRARTVSLGDAMRVIGQEQADLFRDVMTGAAWEHLTRVVLAVADDGTVIQRFREIDAVRLLAPMKQPTVNAHKRIWLDKGFIRPDGRTGAAEWFTLTGEALLAMLPAASAAGIAAEAFLRGRNLETIPLPPHSVAVSGKAMKKKTAPKRASP